LQWDITCEVCNPTYGGECQLAPTHLKAPTDTETALCASVPSEQYGALYLKDCNLFVSPPNYEQLFYFGQNFFGRNWAELKEEKVGFST
jgi:hypothetical protein